MSKKGIYISCPDCYGEGIVPDQLTRNNKEIPCPTCKGTGKKRVPDIGVINKKKTLL